MQETKISIKNKQGEKLVGLRAVPDSNLEKYPTVLLVHGFGVTKEGYGMFDILSERLTENGMQVYRFDFSGSGESEGDYSETTLTKLKNDLEEIVKYVRSQTEVDLEKFGIVAQSLGTSTTIALAPEMKCLICLGAVSHPGDKLPIKFGENYHPDGISSRVRSNGTVTTVKPSFWQDFKNYDLVDSIKNISCPILFINGGADTDVSISEMQAYFDVVTGPKEKVLIEGLDHGMNPDRDKMCKVVVGWLNKNLVNLI